MDMSQIVCCDSISSTDHVALLVPFAIQLVQASEVIRSRCSECCSSILDCWPALKNGFRMTGDNRVAEEVGGNASVTPSAQAALEPVQYYLAVPGIPGAELALLAARAAVVAHHRFYLHPGYSRWYNGSMAKVVLRAEADAMANLARTREGIAIPSSPDVPQLVVFRPRPKSRAGFLAHLKLYTGRLARTPMQEWPQQEWPHERAYVAIFANADLELSAGKFAAQAAHAILTLQKACSGLPDWSRWLGEGLPLALMRAPQSLLDRLIAEGRVYGVHDGGRTEVPAGSLAAAAAPASDLAPWSREPEVALLAHDCGRPVPQGP